MDSTTGRRLAALLGSLLTSALLVVGTGLGIPASAEDRSTTWYLALGDSLAAGVQLAPVPDLTGGFAGQVLEAEQARDPKTRLRNLACHAGETSTSMLRGGPCAYDEGSQFQQALVFLKAHEDDTTLVTLSIGANDVTPCLREPTPQQIGACVQQRLTLLAANLHAMLSQIRSAAPNARVVVGNFYNPFIIDPALGDLSVLFQQALNEQVIRPVATLNGAAVADVAEAFHSYDAKAVAVAYICQHTYMCSHRNIHPRPSGYDLVSGAFIARL